MLHIWQVARPDQMLPGEVETTGRAGDDKRRLASIVEIELPQRRAAQSAEHRPWPAGERRRLPSHHVSRLAMAKRVHPATNGDEPSSTHPA
ncbi:MAG: hypothetical protein V9E83_00045 [Baekduia sp.]